LLADRKGTTSAARRSRFWYRARSMMAWPAIAESQRRKLPGD
jgi:hypothetical protein